MQAKKIAHELNKQETQGFMWFGNVPMSTSEIERSLSF